MLAGRDELCYMSAENQQAGLSLDLSEKLSEKGWKADWH